MEFLLEIIRGMVIGLANIIPGVSGGTMMVSMGIYDTLIHCITHLFKEFKKSVMTLLPYAIGMAAAIGLLSFALKWAFEHYALPTNTLFIGLILGGLPAILRQVKGKKKGAVGAVLLIASFALIIVMQLFQSENTVTIRLSVLEVLKLFVLGAVASATMIIPGVSGSMILKILGYYEPVVTVGIPGFLTGLAQRDWAAVGYNMGILVPFGLGVIVGIFAIAKLIEVLLAHWEGQTYCAILGLVAASPVAILMATNMANLGWGILLISLVTFAIGFYVAWRMSGPEEPALKTK